MKKKLEEAGKHLADAKELPGADEAFHESFKYPLSIIEHVSSILREEKVLTSEEISEDLEEINEFAPREPEVKVLEQKPEELYMWFADLRKWLINYRSQDKLDIINQLI